MKSWAVLFMFLVLGITGCGEKVKVDPPPKVSEKFLEEVRSKSFAREVYRFTSTGARDPFRPITPFIPREAVPLPPVSDAGEASGEDYSDDEFSLGGIVWSPDRPIALIYSTDGKKWIAMGNRIVYPEGAKGYRVSISEDRVLLETPGGEKIDLRLSRG